MTRLQRPSKATLMVLLAVSGGAAAAAGVYLLFGLGWVLLVGGVAAAATALLVEVG